MLVSYKWLDQLVNLKNKSAKELSDQLSVTGIEVEGVENLASGLKKIVVGYVTECVPHPNSDHLSICQVEIAPGEISQIICGAPNVSKGQKVIVALPGARIGDNVKIKKGKMRGEVSNGMICALQELGISDNVSPKEFSDGIYVLPSDAPIGADVLEYLGLNDDIIELSITPNRADALSMHGVAYEVGAMLNETPHFPEIHFSENTTPVENLLEVAVEDEDTLSYHLKIVQGVKIAPSPLWLQMLLIKEGIRPINNVVDVTNYVLLEYGQPLHAFDYNKLGSKKILVRKALENETLKTLDGEERTLTTDDSVITNGKIPLGLAGVMGGLDSEITDYTVDVVIESAVFLGNTIRQTSKRYNLRSEASARFEKGINVGTVNEALNRACQLITELAGGTVTLGTLTGKALEKEEPVVTVTLSKINRYLGTELSLKEVEDIFAQLQFKTEVKDETFYVTVPLRRWDIFLDADLIEEVARIYGYDKIPTTLPSGETTMGSLTQSQKLTRELRHSLNGAGLMEAISYALTTEKKATQFTFNEENKKVTSLMWPMSMERSVLRLNLISGLLDDINYNVARNNENIAFYEIGRIFQQENDPAHDLPEEKVHLAIALCGEFPEETWETKGQKVDFYTLKGLMERIFNLYGIKNYHLKRAASPDLHPGRSGLIYVKETLVGVLGQVHPQVAKDYDIPETYVLEIDLETLYALGEGITYEAVSKFPRIHRDLAVLVKKEISHEAVSNLIKEKGGKYLKEVTLFDRYTGKGVLPGEKSLAYSLAFSSVENTLVDEDIQKAMEKIIQGLKEELDAEIR